MNKEHIPLVEKYRPKKLNDIIGNKNEIDFLKIFLKNNHIPNLILEGDPGTGKTSAIFAFVNEYLGDLYETNCLELNASDDRGIEIVRSKIKTFSQKKIDKHKIIILDEADNMTSSAQFALRRTMEQFDENTRFLFTCNNIENIIDAIQSRCIILNFGKIPINEIEERIWNICKNENIMITKKGISVMIELYDNRNDVRGIINLLELINANFYGKRIDDHKICEICDKPSPKIIRKIILHIKEKNLMQAVNLVIELKKEGFSNVDICTILYCEILNYFPKNIVLKMYEIIGDYNKLFLEGYENILQLSDLIIKLESVVES